MKRILFFLSALAALTLAGCKEDPVIPDGPDGPDDPEVPVDPNAPGIRSAADFMAFAAAVNAGEETTQWQNEAGWINLLADIDFEGVDNFEPVGHATAPWADYNPVVTEGHPFAGKFDGNAHHIKNLHLTCAETVAGKHFGLFGYLAPGAIVQNFVIDDSCSLTVTTSVSLSAGVVAGVLYDATVRDVTSRAPMTYQGGATGYLHMAMIGGLYAKDEGCTLDSVHNYGKMTVENTANLNAGATGIHCAGIAGFANAPTGNEKRNRIAECNNYGEMVSQAGRQAGILAAANACTDIVNCENRGNQTNSMGKNDGTRLGNICCFASNNSSITGCKNYGNLISTTGGRVGGIVSLPNAGSYENNENYGEIISDSDYRGVFFGYVTQAAAWKGGKASGKVGKYNGGEYVYDVYTEAEKVKYLGKDGSSGKATFTNVEIDIATGEGPVADPQIDIPADFRIFFIGNSFTMDAVTHLPKILNAAGLNKIQMVHMYFGGRTIPEYNNGWSSVTDYHCYVCNPGETGWTELSGKSLAQIAASGKWDVVTIQEHTGKQLAWGWTETEKAAVQGLVDKVKAAQTENGGSPKLYYILSQAYHNLNKAENVTKPFATTSEMWTIIAAHGRSAVEECGFDGVISTGAMLQNLRTSGLNNELGLTRDGYHMDYGIARYGASCTVFETVIGPFNGNVKLDGNTFRTVGDSEGTTAITDARAPIALKAARYAIAKPYEVTDMEGEGGETGPDQPVVPDNISISNATELVAFATRVNSGDEAAAKATVTLSSDIDCSSVTSWTPIGNCTLPTWAHNSVVTSGMLFTGTFDGQNHSIKNLRMNFTPSDANGAWGLFGGIGDGAVVKNLIFDISCSMRIETAKAGVFGMLAGLVLDATVDNVKNYAPIMGGGTSDLADNAAGGRVAVGGLIGWVHASTKDITVSNLLYDGMIGTSSAEFTRGGNSGNGANGFMLGGVIGFSSNNNNTKTVTLSNLKNDADIYTNAGRVSGIVSSANRYTIIKNALNVGDVHYSGNGTLRPANITCIAGEGTQLEDCVNRGDLIAPSSASAAGVVCLVNHASVKITRCKSLGATIVCKGFNVTDNKATYAGALFGYCNNAATFSGCSVSGKVGTGLDNLLTLTTDNYFPFAGQATANCPSATATNITFAE